MSCCSSRPARGRERCIPGALREARPPGHHTIYGSKSFGGKRDPVTIIPAARTPGVATVPVGVIQSAVDIGARKWAVPLLGASGAPWTQSALCALLPRRLGCPQSSEGGVAHEGRLSPLGASLGAVLLPGVPCKCSLHFTPAPSLRSVVCERPTGNVPSLPRDSNPRTRTGDVGNAEHRGQNPIK